jgi:hypothetical protein
MRGHFTTTLDKRMLKEITEIQIRIRKENDYDFVSKKMFTVSA